MGATATQGTPQGTLPVARAPALQWVLQGLSSPRPAGVGVRAAQGPRQGTLGMRTRAPTVAGQGTLTSSISSTNSVSSSQGWALIPHSPVSLIGTASFLAGAWGEWQG